jgi:hypothetical protein
MSAPRLPLSTGQRLIAVGALLADLADLASRTDISAGSREEIERETATLREEFEELKEMNRKGIEFPSVT